MSKQHFEIPTSPSSPYKYKHKPMRKFKSIPTELYTSDLNSQDYDSSMLNDTEDYRPLERHFHLPNLESISHLLLEKSN